MKDVVLITGGAGVIGANLTKKLLQSNSAKKIIIVDNLSSGKLTNINDLNVEFYNADITNSERLKLAFTHKPNKIYHLAALFANQNSVDHPEKDLSVNGVGTINTLRESIASNVEKVLYASSSCVYGNHKNMAEKNVGELDTPYAITKLLGEHYLRFYSNHYNLEATSVRIFNTYGPCDYPGMYRNVIPNFFLQAIQGKPLAVHGNGNSIRTYTYVEDLVDGLIHLMNNVQNENKYDVFNFGSSDSIKTIDLANMINKITSNKAGVIFQPTRSWDHITSRKPNLEKSSKFGQSINTYSLEEGLNKYYQWLVNDKEYKKLFN